MCGVIGKISREKKINRDEFIYQRDLMLSRGPDNEGLYINNLESVALGYRRLSIVDLSDKANQPLANENNTIFLVCNGEIYNSPQLREELMLSGHVFHSHSDSEVILHGYEEWGMGCMKKLEGMFAFGIWDSEKQCMLIARDRFGIKPLYYEYNAHSFTFASNIKSIVAAVHHPKEIAYDAVCDYLTYRYVPSPKSIFKGINKLEPAHYLLIDQNYKYTHQCYWQPEYKPQNLKKEEVSEQVRWLLKQSVRKHLLSDVPVGCFLSSGYDSSTLALLLKEESYNPLTFSIGFERWENSEHILAQKTARTFGFENYTSILGADDHHITSQLIEAYDEPIADISIIPTYLISKLASQKVKTVVSGEGADELFGGYDWYRRAMSEWANKKWSEKIFSSPSGLAMNVYKYYTAMGSFDAPELKQILMPEYHQYIPENSYWFFDKHFKRELPLPKSLQYLDIKGFMGELVLTKVDRASMAHALEVRVPFLDYELFDFLYSLKPAYYFSNSEQKPLLAGIIKNKLPEIVNRKKQGFVGPDEFYNQKEFYKKIMDNSEWVNQGIFNKGYISSLSENEDKWRLWKIVVLEWWLQKHVLSK